MSLFSPKVSIKSAEEVAKIRESALIVSKALALIAANLKVGVTGLSLDKLAEEFILDSGGKPAFKGFHGFPNSLCISVNDAVVHGIPSDRPFASGDILSIDCGVEKNGYFGDSAYTFGLGDVDSETVELLRITHESLYRGIEYARVGFRLGDIGWAIQEFTEKQHGYGVVRDLVGHGIGTDLHEPPQVPNYGKRGNGMKLEEGWVIAIEPMINMGTKNVYHAKDKWTILTADHKPSAHFEHTLRVGKNSAEILSDHSFLEEEIKNNTDIVNISKNI